MELGKKFGKNSEGIGNGAAINTGMEIAHRPGQLDLVIIQPAQAVGDRRDALAQHRGVGDNQGIRLQFFLVALHITPKG